MEPGRILDEFGSIGEPGQIRVVPGTTMLEHQFMDMGVAPRVHDLFGAICLPGIASNSNTICCRGTRKLTPSLTKKQCRAGNQRCHDPKVSFLSVLSCYC